MSSRERGWGAVDAVSKSLDTMLSFTPYCYILFTLDPKYLSYLIGSISSFKILCTFITWYFCKIYKSKVPAVGTWRHMAAIFALDTPINTASLFIEPISQLLLFLTRGGARIAANKKSNIDAAQGSQYLTSGPMRRRQYKMEQVSSSSLRRNTFLAASWLGTRVEVAPNDPIKLFHTRLNPISDFWSF